MDDVVAFKRKATTFTGNNFYVAAAATAAFMLFMFVAVAAK